MLGDESLCASCRRNLTHWPDSRPTNEKYFKLANSRGKPCPKEVLIAGWNLKLFRLAYHRLFHMSKLSMERHLTQMQCDFATSWRPREENYFLVKYSTKTSTKQPLQPTCNIVRLQSLHSDTDPTTPVTKNFKRRRRWISVSYTHLTLPTKLEV